MNNQLFQTAVHSVHDVIQHVSLDDMNKPTPCSEWNVRQLLNHIVSEVAWIKPLLHGKTIDEVGGVLDGDLLGDTPAEAWQAYKQEAQQAVTNAKPDTIAHLSYADKPAQAYIAEVSADMIVHGWDLARAIGLEYVIEDTIAQQCLDATKDIMPSGRQYGFIGPAITVANNASAAEKMLAEFGRSTQWTR